MPMPQRRNQGGRRGELPTTSPVGNNPTRLPDVCHRTWFWLLALAVFNVFLEVRKGTFSADTSLHRSLSESLTNPDSLLLQIPGHESALSSPPLPESTATSTDSILPRPRQVRVLQAVLGMDVANSIFTSLDDLNEHQPILKDLILTLENSLDDFATGVIDALDTQINPVAAKEELTQPGPPSIQITEATYGQSDGGERSDVRWLLEPFIFNSVLRLPAGYSVLSLFGSKPKMDKSDNKAPFTLEVKATTSKGPVSTSVAITPDWKLANDLLISSAQPTQEITKPKQELNNLFANLFREKQGIEIGGPSPDFEVRGIYKNAKSVDLANFSEDTMWGTFKDKSTFNFRGGGSGLVHITDGSTLEGLPDQSYDFAIGSHYLEHLINPLRALATMLRVLRPGGHVVLILPRKEKCFDHHRGTTRIEDILARHIHKATENDYQYSSFEAFSLQNDLKMDPPAGNVEQLRARNVRFQTNRGIHTTVWDFKLIQQVAKVMNCEVVFQSTEGLNQWNVLRKL